MLVIQRRNKIKEMLFRHRMVKVSDLVTIFDVSEETIRRDLNYLEQEGLIKKNYGGAILLEDLHLTEQIPPVHQRQSYNFPEKDAIGKMAATLVAENQIVILDAGTTTWCVARHMKNVDNMMFVTNGINVAEECSVSESSTVYLIGGKLIKKSMSLVGPQAMNELQKYNADYVFLGASGISLQKGFTSSDIFEAEVKRAMVAAGQKVVIVADHTKFGRQGLVSFCQFDDVDMLITSELVEPTIIRAIEELGIEVLTCPVMENEGEEIAR